MFEDLKNFSAKPQPYSVYTAPELWSRPHLARQMLKFHLDPATPLASRQPGQIDAIVSWLDETVSLKGKRLLDLGCGPGLYAERFCDKGAAVTGLDLSEVSLAHARAEAMRRGLGIAFLLANYVTGDLPGGFDLITLIYCDYGALSPAQRQSLLAKIKGALKPGGRFVFDVNAAAAFETVKGESLIEPRLMDGFWAPGDYVGLKKTFRYPQELVSLDRYLIIEPGEVWQIYNWTQFFTVGALKEELTAAGFEAEHVTGSLAGEALTDTGSLIGGVAKPV